MKLDFISQRGDVLHLVNNPLFHLAHVDGQTTAGTSLAAATVGGADGDTVNNVQATPRTIVIDLRIKSGVNVEDATRQILSVVKLKQKASLMWEQNNQIKTITGIVENVNMPRWANITIMQITLHCEQPFWEDIADVVRLINEATDLHYFVESPVDMLYFPEVGLPLGEYDTARTKTFQNHGDVAVGLEIRILAHDTVTNPIIYDQHGNYFGLGYTVESGSGAGIGTAWQSVPVVMQAGDEIVITTHKGNKKVMFNGVNMFDKIKPLSTWLQLDTGDNTFSINSDDESITNMSFSLIYKQRYI